MKIDVFSGALLVMAAFIAGYWFAIFMEGAADLRKKSIESGCAYYDPKTAEFKRRKLQ